MHRGRLLSRLAALVVALAAAPPAFAQDPDFVLVQRYEYSSAALDGGSSSSGGGGTALAERILAHGPEGIEIEYSIPMDPDEVRGNAMWMYPARVMVAPDGSKWLLNADELDQRVDEWLELGGWTREHCSRWLFTWTAVQIQCDPQAVLDEVEAYDMRPGALADGSELVLAERGVVVVLSQEQSSDERRVLTGEAPLNADFVRREIAQGAVVVAQISGEELSFEEALADTARLDISGSISITLELDRQGLVWKRTEVTDTTIIGGEYGDERRQMETVVNRFSYADWVDSGG